MQLPIEDHGIVGDLRTVALVGLDGAIDYLCWPRIDSPSVFASLLEEARGGRFEIEPVLAEPRRQQLYLPDTNVLLTRALSIDGVAEISDFMCVTGTGEPQRLVRRAKAVRGTVRFRLRCAPRFDYARASHAVELAANERAVTFTVVGNGGAAGTGVAGDRAASRDGESEGPIAREGAARNGGGDAGGRDGARADTSADAGPRGDDGVPRCVRLRLSASVALELDGDDAVAEFELAHGESACFALDAGEGAVHVTDDRAGEGAVHGTGGGGVHGNDGRTGEGVEHGTDRRAGAVAGDGPGGGAEDGTEAGNGRAHGDGERCEPDVGGDPSPADPRRVSAAFKATADWWRAWSGRSCYRGRWRDQVDRSALALKLLTSAEHGSIVAAATFGLPETPGGERNWDYRYTWIRDAAFTVYAFVRVGHVAEANAFLGWLDRLTTSMCADGTLEVMYRVDGTSGLEETALEHFSGYRGATPVRVGNGAHDQLQLDIYGELMDAIYLADKHGDSLSRDAWENVRRMLGYVEANWREPDEGIWEVRNGRRELLFSRLMCWVALDRGVRLATKRSLPAPLDRWRETRDAIHEDIHEHFWNEELGAFVQSRDGHALDASCLLMPLVRFIAPSDPRWRSTLAAIGERLTDDSLVYRYSIEEGEDADGLDGIEGTFNMCSFWYVECLARAGEVEQARFLFEKMLGYANHLGLFAEETGVAGEQLGNFPQAFTHLALISAAHYLDRVLGPC